MKRDVVVLAVILTAVFVVACLLVPGPAPTPGVVRCMPAATSSAPGPGAW